MNYIPTDRRDLGLKCQAEYSKYRSWLEAECRKLGLEIGVDIAGTAEMEKQVDGKEASRRYAAHMTEIHRLNQAFMNRGRVVDRAQEAADNRAMAIKRAQQAVQFATDFLAQETERAAICLQLGVCTEDEKEEIIDEAEEKLEDAHEDLAAIQAAASLPVEDRAARIRDAIGSYTGPRNKKYRPKRNPLRLHAGIVDITVEEIIRYSKAAKKPSNVAKGLLLDEETGFVIGVEGEYRK